MSVAEEIFAIFERRGAGAYFGERVSMREHALQAAHLATHEGAAIARRGRRTGAPACSRQALFPGSSACAAMGRCRQGRRLEDCEPLRLCRDD